MTSKPMKAFKTARAAIAYASGPMLRIGSKLYVAGDLEGLTSVELIDAKGQITGHVTLRHLERLGNANWAEAKKTYNGEKVFKGD